MTKIIGKEINEFAEKRNDLPEYFGRAYNFDQTKRIKGEFMARKYNDIIGIIKETSAQVKIKRNCIFIEYSNGDISIKRDCIINKFLVPALKQI